MEEFLHRKGCETWEGAAQGGGRVPSPGGVQGINWTQHSVLSDKVRKGHRLDLMILMVFSKLNDWNSVQILTLSPRGFSTLGLREKCMWRLPSSLTLTATFLRVLLPQWGQNTLVMSEVVLQGWDGGDSEPLGLWNVGPAQDQPQHLKQPWQRRM